MLEEPPLLTIKRPDRRPTEAQIAFFQTCPPSVVADAMHNAGVLARDIVPLQGEVQIAGPALTAGCGPADIIALFAAQALVAPGDVVMASVDGHQGAAVFGDIVAGRLKNGGAAGLITDGPVRDVPGILETGLPVWCTGRTPASPYSKGPGTLGLSITLGGISIESGDMVVADGDGAVVIPFPDIDATMSRAAQILDMEGKVIAAVADGQVVPEDLKALLDSENVVWVD